MARWHMSRSTNRWGTHFGAECRAGLGGSTVRRLALVWAWATAEATFWPVMPDAVLGPLAAARPDAWWRLAVASMLGSSLGGAISYWIGRHGDDLASVSRLPFVRPAMVRAATAWLREEHARGVRHQPLSGVPFKVFARVAGAMDLPLGRFLLWALAARGLRFLMVSGVAAIVGARLRRPLSRNPVLLIGIWCLLFAAGLRRTVVSWERRSDSGREVPRMVNLQPASA